MWHLQDNHRAYSSNLRRKNIHNYVYHEFPWQLEQYGINWVYVKELMLTPWDTNRTALINRWASLATMVTMHARAVFSCCNCGVSFHLNEFLPITCHIGAVNTDANGSWSHFQSHQLNIVEFLLFSNYYKNKKQKIVPIFHICEFRQILENSHGVESFEAVWS